MDDLNPNDPLAPATRGERDARAAQVPCGRRTRRRLAAAVGVLALVAIPLAGCSSDEDPAPAASVTTSAPVSSAPSDADGTQPASEQSPAGDDATTADDAADDVVTPDVDTPSSDDDAPDAEAPSDAAKADATKADATGEASASGSDSEPAQADEPELTVAQQNAVDKAGDYLSYMSFSRSGLIDQLKYEGFTTKQATFAVDYVDPSWMKQAAKKAKEYLDTMSFSRSGLIEQLEYEGFTTAQAQHGADAAGL